MPFNVEPLVFLIEHLNPSIFAAFIGSNFHVYLPEHIVCMMRGRLSALASGLIGVRGIV